MNLTEIVEKTLSDKSFKGEFTAKLNTMLGSGAANKKLHIQNILRQMIREVATVHMGRPLSESDSGWKTECTSWVNAYLGAQDVAESIRNQKEYLGTAGIVEGSKLHHLDELCRRAVTTALLVQGGISPNEFYSSPACP